MGKHLLVFVLLGLIGAVAPVRTQVPPGTPLRIILLVDSSSAVSPMVTPFRAGLRGFLAQLPGDSEIAFVTTGGSLRIRVAPTRDRRRLEDAVDRFASDGGGNALVSALPEADARLFKTALDKRPVFVVLSSDINSTTAEQGLARYDRLRADFVSRGGRAHAVIVTSGNNSGLPTLVAEDLVEITGGFFETVLTASAVPAVMETIAAYVAADQ